MGPLLWAVAASLPLLVYLYVLRNDRAIGRLPKEVEVFSPKRITDAETIRRLTSNPPSIQGFLPPKTGRRYIIVGGSGFVGGWIVLHLLERDEDPHQIRIIDIRPPVRHDLTSGRAKDVQFVCADISDADSVKQAFTAPWSVESTADITVFHTAAKIGYYERHPSLLPALAKVNVQGTQNIIDAARLVGATALVYTSSAGIAVHRYRLWLWPWEKQPDHFLHIMNDDDSRLPKHDSEFFSNYAITKIRGERLVRAADGSPSGTSKLRTGCIRPGNAIYGPGGDLAHGAYLERKVNITWIMDFLSSAAYVENVSLAHLRYEECLIRKSEEAGVPDVGGQAFMVTDSGPALTHRDLIFMLTTLTDRETTFSEHSATTLLFVAHLIELYVLARHVLLSTVPSLGRMIPPARPDIINLQPSTFIVMMTHIIVDDSRARLPQEKGGLGYDTPWNTYAGIYKTVQEYKKSQAKKKLVGLDVGGAAGPQGRHSNT